jgi:hypothetical protein
MNSGYYPSVVSHRAKIQTESGGFQVPFFFGGSQVPTSLHLQKGSYSGSGFGKDTPSQTHKGDLDFTTKKGDKVYHQKGKYVVKPFKIPYVK